MAKICDINPVAFDQSGNEYLTAILSLVENAVPTRINTYHIIYKIFSTIWNELDENNLVYIKKNLPTLKQQFLKCRENMKKLFGESNVFSFMDDLQVEFTQYQRLFSLRSDVTISDVSTLINYAEGETSKSPFDQIPLQKSSKKSELNIRFDIHEFLLIYEFVTKSSPLSISIIGRDSTLSLSSVLSPKPEYCPGDEAVMVNRETIRCSITSPQAFSQPIANPPKKPTTPTRPIPGNGAIHTTPKKDNREMRHIFFDSNYLYIVTVDVNRIGFGIVEETVPLFSVQVSLIQFTILI